MGLTTRLPLLSCAARAQLLPLARPEKYPEARFHAAQNSCLPVEFRMRFEKLVGEEIPSAGVAIAGMARFGMNPRNTFGDSLPTLRRMAGKIGRNHALAQELWDSDVHEARILAGLIDDAALVTERQMEEWAKDFDSWDICDGCCNNLFRKTAFAYPTAIDWPKRKEEFVNRAGLVLMACLAVHDKAAKDVAFERFLRLIQKVATDERNFVKKAVNWALRQIGKRNRELRRKAIQAAREIRRLNSSAARWIASDALRELTSERTRVKGLPRR